MTRKELREDVNLTLEDVAEALEIGVSTVHNIERGRQVVSPKTIERYDAFLEQRRTQHIVKLVTAEGPKTTGTS